MVIQKKLQLKRADMKNALLKLLLVLCLLQLAACAGTRSDQIPTITGDNNTITINQAASVDKASETKVDAAGSGYGSVTK